MYLPTFFVFAACDSSVAPCDNLPAADGTVDLVTVSEAIHWFLPLGIDKFYTEVDRVLKPNGCLAVYEYSRPEYVNHPNAAEMNQASREVDILISSFVFWSPTSGVQK